MRHVRAPPARPGRHDRDESARCEHAHWQPPSLPPEERQGHLRVVLPPPRRHSRHRDRPRPPPPRQPHPRGRRCAVRAVPRAPPLSHDERAHHPAGLPLHRRWRQPALRREARGYHGPRIPRRRLRLRAPPRQWARAALLRVHRSHPSRPGAEHILRRAPARVPRHARGRHHPLQRLPRPRAHPRTPVGDHRHLLCLLPPCSRRNSPRGLPRGGAARAEKRRGLVRGGAARGGVRQG
mmetsp:Transcript_4879/g.16267  ORF Transcript_4879/g.16267 Transcript_4879/m.16267 type:complete len:237 (-) Transcript_4879:481-1191(-)